MEDNRGHKEAPVRFSDVAVAFGEMGKPGKVPSPKAIEAVVSPNYKGPGKSFPFRSFRVAGYIHLALGISTQMMALIQLSLGPEHRDIFLQYAAAPLWCPIPVIAVGILGLCMSRKRYWEVRCMKVCFGVLSLINAFLFMVIMGALVGFYGYWYYSVSTFEPAEADEELVMQEDPGYTTVVTIILIAAGLEVLVSFFSFFICCCCAIVKRPGERPEIQPTPHVDPRVVNPDKPRKEKKEKKKKDKTVVQIQKTAAPPVPQESSGVSVIGGTAGSTLGLPIGLLNGAAGAISAAGPGSVILLPAGGLSNGSAAMPFSLQQAASPIQAAHPAQQVIYAEASRPPPFAPVHGAASAAATSQPTMYMGLPGYLSAGDTYQSVAGVNSPYFTSIPPKM